jgi:hypothetical protein
MEINFSETKDITIVAEKKKSLDKLTIEQMVDFPSRKLVVAITSELGRIRLWQGAEYDAIGQWTDTDVVNRIQELYGA